MITSRSASHARTATPASSGICVKMAFRSTRATMSRCVAQAPGGHLAAVRYLHENGVELTARNNEALCRACESGHLHVVRYLHEQGVPLSARNNEPLCHACGHGHLGVVRYLHENGVSLNARNNEPICRACEAATWTSSAISIKTGPKWRSTQ